MFCLVAAVSSVLPHCTICVVHMYIGEKFVLVLYLEYVHLVFWEFLGYCNLFFMFLLLIWNSRYSNSFVLLCSHICLCLLLCVCLCYIEYALQNTNYRLWIETAEHSSRNVHSRRTYFGTYGIASKQLSLTICL